MNYQELWFNQFDLKIMWEADDLSSEMYFIFEASVSIFFFFYQMFLQTFKESIVMPFFCPTCLNMCLIPRFIFHHIKHTNSLADIT